MGNPGELLTIGEVASRLNAPLHKVTYVVRTRNIQPERRAGGLRLFGAEGVRAVETALRGVQVRTPSR